VKVWSSAGEFGECHFLCLSDFLEGESRSTTGFRWLPVVLFQPRAC
jgi:hypothetical protein